MDINYKEVIDFSILKDLIKEKRTTVKYVAEDVGIDQQRISMIIGGWNQPKTDIVVRIAWALKVPVSKIVNLKIDADEIKERWFSERTCPYTPPAEAKGELTYEPLFFTLSMYLDYYNTLKDEDKKEDDIFDLIEPYRRRNGVPGLSGDSYKKALEARGFGADYKSERTGRKYEAKGLIPAIRSKLRKNKPLSMRTVYDICNFFGCSIDWVVSYK